MEKRFIKNSLYILRRVGHRRRAAEHQFSSIRTVQRSVLAPHHWLRTSALQWGSLWAQGWGGLRHSLPFSHFLPLPSTLELLIQRTSQELTWERVLLSFSSYWDQSSKASFLLYWQSEILNPHWRDFQQGKYIPNYGTHWIKMLQLFRQMLSHI